MLEPLRGAPAASTGFPMELCPRGVVPSDPDMAPEQHVLPLEQDILTPEQHTALGAAHPSGWGPGSRAPHTVPAGAGAAHLGPAGGALQAAGGREEGQDRTDRSRDRARSSARARRETRDKTGGPLVLPVRGGSAAPRPQHSSAGTLPLERSSRARRIPASPSLNQDHHHRTGLVWEEGTLSSLWAPGSAHKEALGSTNRGVLRKGLYSNIIFPSPQPFGSLEGPECHHQPHTAMLQPRALLPPSGHNPMHSTRLPPLSHYLIRSLKYPGAEDQ